MKKLIQFELRKILWRPLSLSAIAVILLLSSLFSFSSLQSMYAFDGSSREGSGQTAVAIDKTLAEKYGGILTDDKILQMLSAFQPSYDLHGMNAKYLYQNALQSAVFARFADKDGNWNGLRVSDVFGNAEIKAGYVRGWLSTSQNMIRIFLILSFVIIVLTAPVFSGEYNGVDSMILTSRYGQTKCAVAKGIASLLSVVLVTALTAAFHLVFAFTAYGTDGLDCSILFAPLEFSEGYIPFNITCGTAIQYQLLLAFTGAISVTGITLLLSALCKNPLITLVASTAIHFAPTILPISETNPFYRLVVLLPVYHAQYISVMSVEQMQNKTLYAIWALPVAVTLAAVGFLISRRRFAKHQITS